MEKLKEINDCLICCVHREIEQGLDRINTKELGEAIDMIKDLAETMYYHTIVKSMESGVQDTRHHMSKMTEDTMTETHITEVKK